MRSVIVIICLCSSFRLLAQDDAEVTLSTKTKSNYDSLRDQYIQRYPNHFFLWPVIKKRSLRFDVEDMRSGTKLTYRPNNSTTLGFGAYLFDIGLEFTFAVPVDSYSKYLYGASKSKDIQLNVLSKKFGFDLYYQKYWGFYQSDSRTGVPPGDPYPQRNDIVTRNFGLAGVYIFNSKQFSFKSAYLFSERQLQSRGSFILMGSINSFKLTADSSVLSSQYRPSFGSTAAFDKLKYTSLSFAPGYTYSVVYKKFFLNGTLALGPAHNWISYHLKDGKAYYDIAFNGYAAIRIALGYNSDRFFAGVNFVTQARGAKFGDIRFTNASDTFRMLIGYRFKEFGFLKKSVWDIPRELLHIN